MFYRTADPLPLPRDPFTAIVSPRPIAWITTRGADGRMNLAPYSFFNAVAYTPPQVVVSSVGDKPDRMQGKDTLSHILETGSFCINIAGYEDREALNQSSANYGADVDEAALLGLATAECQVIDCPRLAQAPAALECRLTQIVPLDGAANRLVIARVEAVHLRDDCLQDGRFDVTRYRPLTRLGYSDFGAVDQVFRMKRPQV
ncbi:flavin reductase family protein [Paracoccus shanxieyensis]|uniref:Flavin reductase family protein n=1 Tax=Paracoccus shanxieyensis TaxID=2675752 RepID=A0A6L6IUD2_9RHOB|nr:flavin reductase family protein [Paracoccus shanxieyensis]MTH64086.1 flavin reductase family protein [Paracoccus shanxieyensis]MTH86873.1 flavin reductase family protein [Paracoccus shanxieyensis]